MYCSVMVRLTEVGNVTLLRLLVLHTPHGQCQKTMSAGHACFVVVVVVFFCLVLFL